MTSNYHTPHSNGAPLTAAQLNGPLGELDAVITLLSAAVVDVGTFGAVGDDTTDARTAIQAAIDAMSSLGGGSVILPPGSYVCSASLSLAANVTLIGSGHGTVIRFTGTDSGNTGLIQFTGNHAAVLNLKLYDARTYAGNPIASVGVRMSDYDYGRVEGCWITGFKGGGITGRDVLSPTVRGNIIENIGDRLSLVGDGILFQPSAAVAKRVSISDNIVRVCGKHGINVAGTASFGITDVNVVGNICTENGDTGITGAYMTGAQFVGNDCMGNGVAKTLGAATGGQGLQVSNSTDVTVTGNSACDNTEAGIEVRDTSTGVTVTGNICKRNDFAGIKLNGSGVTQVVVSGNNCSSQTDKGIELINGPSDITVSGNTCILNTLDGIGISGTPAGARIQITGNNCSNNSQGTTSTSSGISIGGSVTDLTVTGNVCRSDIAKVQLWGIRYFSGDRVLIVGNQARGNTNQIAAAPESGGSTNYLIANNLAT